MVKPRINQQKSLEKGVSSPEIPKDKLVVEGSLIPVMNGEQGIFAYIEQGELKFESSLGFFRKKYAVDYFEARKKYFN